MCRLHWLWSSGLRIQRCRCRRTWPEIFVQGDVGSFGACANKFSRDNETCKVSADVSDQASVAHNASSMKTVAADFANTTTRASNFQSSLCLLQCIHVLCLCHAGNQQMLTRLLYDNTHGMQRLMRLCLQEQLESTNSCFVTQAIDHPNYWVGRDLGSMSWHFPTYTATLRHTAVACL